MQGQSKLITSFKQTERAILDFETCEGSLKERSSFQRKLKINLIDLAIVALQTYKKVKLK